MLRKDFLWGGAVTAHQSEGGYTLDGKVPAVCDLTVTGEYSDFKDGIDSYHRYEDLCFMNILLMHCLKEEFNQFQLYIILKCQHFYMRSIMDFIVAK